MCIVRLAMSRVFQKVVEYFKKSLHSHIHSFIDTQGLKQGRRLASLDKFRGGRCKILVATDVASRGLDIPSVALVCVCVCVCLCACGCVWVCV